jgi:hypothetical protein
MNSTTRLELEGAFQDGSCRAEGDKNCQLSVGLRLPQTGHYLTRENTHRVFAAENKRFRLDFGVTLGSTLWCIKCDRVYVPAVHTEGVAGCL